MIRSIKSLRGHAIHATDGDLGTVSDFFFDDETWTVRYLIVETGNWLTGRPVLISPLSVQSTDWRGRHINVTLTRQQVRHAPDIDLATPVARQKEMELFRYYGWPGYWTGGGLWGPWMGPGMASSASATVTPPPPASTGELTQPQPAESSGDQAGAAESHLRSIDEVLGYRVHGTDGLAGTVSDFLLQDLNWSIQYLVLETGSWRPGGTALLRPGDIARISWVDREVYMQLDCATIKKSPRYDPNDPPESGPWAEQR